MLQLLQTVTLLMECAKERVGRLQLDPAQSTVGNTDAESSRNSVSQGRTHSLAIQYQTVNPENINTNIHTCT